MTRFHTHTASARCVGALLLLGVFGMGAAAAEESEPPDRVDYEELANLSLEELMNVEVTSVAGVGRGYFETPAAIYVIDAEEVRRTGHRTLAEALRLVPGVTVLHTDANTWTVGIRGFNTGFANKTLILIDGRTTYDPLQAGTFWDVQDILLEDLDRIEVIRGPGATLWGANAVNGVINVTTKRAKDTQGFYFGSGIGTEMRGFAETRYGWQVSDNSWARVWGKWADYDAFDLPGLGSNHDDWDMARGGYRYDMEGDDHAFFTLQGDVYGGDRIGETSGFDGRADGMYQLFRFGREVPDGDGWQFQAYYDMTERSSSGGFEVDRDTVDLDFRHHFKWGDIHETVWGIGYRHTRDRTERVSFTAPIPGVLAFDPRTRSYDTFSGFVQDTITLSPDKLFFMIGTKLEHNDASGFEVQPSGRLWWTPNDRHTLWGAVSRPVRTPARTDQDFLLVFPPVLTLLPSPDVESEELLAYEFGHRVRVTDAFTVDTALFFNDYRNLVSLETASGPFPLVQTFGNGGAAESYGVEVAATWRVADNWRLHGSYSFIDVHETSPSVDNPEGASPRHMAQLRSALDVTKDLEFNAALYYFDSVPRLNVNHYLRLDLGLTWHVNDQFDLTLWGQNLLDDSHREGSGAPEFERGVYLMGSFRF